MSGGLTDQHLHELSMACDLQLASFRRAHVEARVERALAMHGELEMPELRARILRDDAVRRAFRRSVAISVTGFFRDPEQFEVLRTTLRDDPRPTRAVRAWSAGCATGEEAWSIAATLAQTGRAGGALVLGSDLLAENVGQARTLVPTTAQLGGARIPASTAIRFERRDVVHQSAPGAGWDLILCRNVAIYLAPDCRHLLHRALAGALRPGGLLMLGRSERLGDPGGLGLERVASHLYRVTM
jgi:chemotaxis protein methyltransferase CheR